MRNLEQALRRSKGRKLLPSVLARVGAALGHDFGPEDLLDLDETDALRARMIEIRRTGHLDAGPWCLRLILPHTASDEIARVLRAFGRRVPEPAVVCLGEWSDLCGGLVAPPAVVFDHVLALAPYDGNELTVGAVAITTRDGRSGLDVTRFEDDIPERIAISRTVAWGDAWCTLLRTVTDGMPSLY